MLQATTREDERNNTMMQPTTAFWFAHSSVRRILKRGAGTSENLRKTNITIKNCSTHNQSNIPVQN